MKDKVDVAAIIATMSEKFAIDCIDHITAAELSVQNMVKGIGDFDENLESLLRLVHTVQGCGGTFGYPTISVIAQRLEVYVEALDQVPPHLDKIQVFLNKIREIAEDRQEPEATYRDQILQSLPRAQRRSGASSSAKRSHKAA